MQWKRIDMHCVFADYVCVTMLDTHSNHYCFSKYLCYNTGLYIILKCNLRACTKNTATRVEHMLNFKLIRNDYN